MSQVLVVNQQTGQYYSIDAEGKRIPKEDSTEVGYSDADVLLNRIAEGYVEIPYGHIVMRLDLNGIYPSDYFEFTDIIVPKCVGNVGEMFGNAPDQEFIRDPLVLKAAFEDISIYRQLDKLRHRVAVIDYEAETVQWLVNPIADDPYAAAMVDASIVVGDSHQCDLVNRAMGFLSNEFPLHRHFIEVVTRVS